MSCIIQSQIKLMFYHLGNILSKIAMITIAINSYIAIVKCINTLHTPTVLSVAISFFLVLREWEGGNIHASLASYRPSSSSLCKKRGGSSSPDYIHASYISSSCLTRDYYHYYI